MLPLGRLGPPKGDGCVFVLVMIILFAVLILAVAGAGPLLLALLHGKRRR